MSIDEAYRRQWARHIDATLDRAQALLRAGQTLAAHRMISSVRRSLDTTRAARLLRTTESNAHNGASQPERQSMEQHTDKIAQLTVNVVVAARLLGISKDAAYTAIKNEKFPCRVIRIGNRRVIPKADLARTLGISERALATRIDQLARR